MSACTGAAMPAPDRVITGSFGREVEGAYVMVPFEVPAGTDAVRIKYCHDQPILSTRNAHTIDMGIYEARDNPGGVWGAGEFRGWGGSSRKDVTISPEASIDPPNPVASTETTVGYRPGPIPAGEWAVELGVAAIGTELATEDGKVAWRVEVDLIDDPAYSDQPFEPVPFDPAPANPQPGWYAGDFHVHARHSNPRDATMREVFDYAFAPLGEGAGLDFITLSDYVSDRAWGEIGAFQPDYPGKQVIRSAEVITYRGHLNNHASATFVDYRAGPILEATLSGTGPEAQVSSTAEVRPARPASEIFDDIHAAGGWTQINHPTIFPSEIPTFSSLCRGCSWGYSAEETDYKKVDAIEIATGPGGLQDAPLQPGPNPFTPLAIRFYEDGIDAGGVNSNKIAAVGSSDSHNAGDRDDPLTQAPIGQATTVVRAPELSEAGIEEGVRQRHTYVKVWGQTGPDLRLEAAPPASGDPPAIIGDVIEADSASFTATVSNLDSARAARPGTYALSVLRDGRPLLTVPLPPTGDTATLEFPSLGHARYGLGVHRPLVGGASIEAYSTPIWLEPAAGDPPPPAPDCSVKLTGTAGPDVFAGTPGSDAFDALRGRDRVKGRGGNDCLDGGGGADRVKGGAGVDVLRGRKGRDRLNSVDGEADQVGCGGGHSDRARADALDAVRGCERVRIVGG
ncbi:MAG: CehA/McbA family metallohydrolase [Solirubrobacterales bacterium]